jgi:predicted small secreted protein
MQEIVMRAVLAFFVAFTTLSVAACSTIGGGGLDLATAARDMIKAVESVK